MTVQNEVEAIGALAGVSKSLTEEEFHREYKGYIVRSIASDSSYGLIGYITRDVKCGQIAINVTQPHSRNFKVGMEVGLSIKDMEFLRCITCNSKINVDVKHACPKDNCSRCGLQSPCEIGCHVKAEPLVSTPECAKAVTAHAPQEMVDGLLVSADTLPYHHIPAVALRYLAMRIQLGEEIKGKDAFHALSENQHVLNSRKALARRLGHVISHTMGLLDKIGNNKAWTEEDVKEASAVMWGGMYAICSIDKQLKPAK